MANNARSTSRTRAAETAGEKTATAGVRQAQAQVSQLSSLVEGRPQSKLGQVRRVWPEIKAALRDGHQLKQVWECLVGDGIELSWSKFRTYIARLRKLEAAGVDMPSGGTQPVETALPRRTPQPDSTKRDALANLRERTSNRPGFEFDERPPDVKKLI
jgi:hypothetical protein